MRTNENEIAAIRDEKKDSRMKKKKKKEKQKAMNDDEC